MLKQGISRNMKPIKVIILIVLLLICVNLVCIQANVLIDKSNLFTLLDSLEFNPEFGAFTNYINPYHRPSSCIYVGSSRSINNSPAKTWLRFKVNGQIVKDIELNRENSYSRWISPKLDFALLGNGRKLDVYNADGKFLRSYKPVEYRYKVKSKKKVIDIIDPSSDKESNLPDSIFKEVSTEMGRYRESSNETRFPAQIMDISKQGLILWKFSERGYTGLDKAIAIEDTNSSILYRNMYDNNDMSDNEFASIAFCDDGEYIAALKNEKERTAGSINKKISYNSNLIIYNKSFKPVFTYKFHDFPSQRGYNPDYNSMKFTGHTLVIAIRKSDYYQTGDKISKKDFNYGAVDIAQQKIYWSK
jgi:hypothetical protein